MKKIPVIVVAGATASGKTSLAISLAKRCGGEIISADSMQIYREMNIGTAKPTREEMCGIPHYLMDFVRPEESFSVADFCEKAHIVAEDIYARSKLVIVAGGTGLYIDSFVNDVDFDDENGEEIRRELEKRAEEEGSQALLDELAVFDAETASKLHPNNVKRIIRAIEYYKIHGEPISVHQAETKRKESRYRPLYLMINHDRQALRDRIDKRVDIMLEQGLEEEALSLYKRRDSLSKTARQAIGYKELFGVFDGTMSLEEATELLKTRTKQYAKRQLTWFGRNGEMNLVKPQTAYEEACVLVDNFLENCEKGACTDGKSKA